MQPSTKNLCITSYNSTGLSLAAQDFISTLSLFSDILCIQEHFLLDSKSKKYSNTDKLRNLFGAKYDMFIVPAFIDITQVSKGRGKGGVATLWDKSLTRYVCQVKGLKVLFKTIFQFLKYFLGQDSEQQEETVQ